MNDNIISLYSSGKTDVKNTFINNMASSLQVKSHYNKVVYDDEWLTKMEVTIRYLDNILRNPNRFIVNDEEIVKIELARRITVDSIKHLAKNTNLIQDYDQKTGEVRPAKILNINKEESFNTYENRFIYSLINNMKLYIEKKKNEASLDSSLKDDKAFLYQGKSKVLGENVEINVSLNSKLNNSSNKDDSSSIISRINKVEEQLRDLCSSEVYKSLAKLHVSLVTSPIKKTNLILKNTNFQYALDLWNYLQAHMESSTKTIKDDKDYTDNGDLKNLMDQSFYLNYLIMETLNKEPNEEVKTEVANQVVHNMVNQLMELDSNLSVDQVKDMVGEQFVKIKYKKVVDTSEIEHIYKDAIGKYVMKTDDLRIRDYEKDE